MSIYPRPFEPVAPIPGEWTNIPAGDLSLDGQSYTGTFALSASGVAGYGHSDRIVTKKLGNLCLCYDELAKSSDDDVLMAPRVILMANWEANLALELILGEDK